MCDKPLMNPWDVVINPAITDKIVVFTVDRVLKRDVDRMMQEIPELVEFPREDVEKYAKAVVEEYNVTRGVEESNLAHIEFDVSRLKSLREEDLRELLQNRLVPRIMEDIKKLEIQRPIPDWCYAFF